MKLKTLNKYSFIFAKSFLQTFQASKSLIGLNILIVTCLSIFFHIWEAIDKINLPYSPSQLLWYVALNEWLIFSIPEVHLDIEQDLRSNQILNFLTKPISYIALKFFHNLATFTIQLIILGIVTFSFVGFWTKYFPFTWEVLIVTFILAYLAGVVFLFFQISIGLSSFWFGHASSFQWIWQKLSFILGGLFLPLSLYPSWIQKISSCTPFPFLIGERSLLIFFPTLGATLHIVSAIILWGFFALIILLIVYKKMIQRVCVNGE